ILSKANVKFAFLLVTLFVGSSVDVKATLGADSQGTSATSGTPAATTGNSEQQGSPVAVAEPERQGLSQRAEEITRVVGFPITNSMIVSWIVAVALIIFVQLATRRMKQVPDGAQNFLEWLVEGLYKFIGGILGPHLTDRTFWFFATVFIFILSANWAGL